MRLVEQAHLLDLSSDAILVRDGQDRILDWNRAAENMYGFTREEASSARFRTTSCGPEVSGPLAGIRETLLRDGRLVRENSFTHVAVVPKSLLFRAGLKQSATKKAI